MYKALKANRHVLFTNNTDNVLTFIQITMYVIIERQADIQSLYLAGNTNDLSMLSSRPQRQYHIGVSALILLQLRVNIVFFEMLFKVYSKIRNHQNLTIRVQPFIFIGAPSTTSCSTEVSVGIKLDTIQTRPPPESPLHNGVSRWTSQYQRSTTNRATVVSRRHIAEGYGSRRHQINLKIYSAKSGKISADLKVITKMPRETFLLFFCKNINRNNCFNHVLTFSKSQVKYKPRLQNLAESRELSIHRLEFALQTILQFYEKINSLYFFTCQHIVFIIRLANFAQLGQVIKLRVVISSCRTALNDTLIDNLNASNKTCLSDTLYTCLTVCLRHIHWIIIFP